MFEQIDSCKNIESTTQSAECGMHDVTRFYWSIDRQSLASVESDQ